MQWPDPGPSGSLAPPVVHPPHQKPAFFSSLLGPTGAIGQSFVAEDSLLGQIAFAFSDLNPSFSNDPVTMTLRQGAGLAGTVVTSVIQTLPAVLPATNASPQFIDFDFTGTALAIGNTYTAVVTTSTSPKIAVVYGPDAYANGQAYRSTGTFAGCTDCDLNFRITPVPIPAGIWLLATGCLGLLGRRWSQGGV
jgi:hypothetical protein